MQSDSVESLFFTTDNEVKKEYQGAEGGLRTWLTEGKTLDLPCYVTEEVRNIGITIVSPII